MFALLEGRLLRHSGDPELNVVLLLLAIAVAAVLPQGYALVS